MKAGKNHSQLVNFIAAFGNCGAAFQASDNTESLGPLWPIYFKAKKNLLFVPFNRFNDAGFVTTTHLNSSWAVCLCITFITCAFLITMTEVQQFFHFL